jgi:acyl-CoA thioester hydrolase
MYEYTTPIEIRFADLDMYGHVNGVAYFTYMETARVKLFSKIFHELARQEIFLVVARAECTYTLPILPGDSLLVSISVLRLGNSSFDLAYRLHDGGGRVYATASTTMVCFDNRSKKSMPIPELLTATWGQEGTT